MKRLFYLFLIIPFLISCNDDDNNGGSGSITINPSAVFTGGYPETVAGMIFSRNEKGLITLIKDYGSTISFEYRDKIKTKATVGENADIVMKYTDKYDSFTIYMNVGSNGFVKDCFQVYDDDEMDTWAFKYNSDGQMIEMKRSEGYNETTNITYENGNIIKVSMKNIKDKKFNSSIFYTSDEHKAGITNKGCIMLFDETFGIDLDEMKYAYYAGILGKSTKKIPLKLIDTDNDETTSFNWTFDNKTYPIKLSYKDGTYLENFEFIW